MKIRHYNTANPGVRRTADVTPKSRKRFKLYLCKGLEDITGDDMKAYLQAVEFNKMFPKWDPPHRWIKVDDGHGSWTVAINPEWEVFIQQYDAQWMDLIAWMEENLTTYEMFQEAELPHEPGTVWELVDESKPYHDGRYTEIPVDPLKYTGAITWKISERDEIALFAEVAKYKRAPAHWLAYNSLYLN